MFRRLIVGSGLGAFLVVSAAVAQPGGAPGAPPPGFPGGPMAFPQPGQVMPAFVQEQLKLTAEQKKQIAELQKEIDAELAKLLTAEQKKALQDLRTGPGAVRSGPGGPGGFGPPGGFGGPFGPPRTDDVKKQLAATDEEWKVINPKLQKVVTARQVLAADGRTPNGGFGFGGLGTNIITQAQDELKTVLNDPKHTQAEVEELVAAVRKARLKAKADLEAAQKDLLQMLTPSQEAVLVSLGYLE
jgi:Spy/CpxP family protein refolding chaperone